MKVEITLVTQRVVMLAERVHVPQQPRLMADQTVQRAGIRYSHPDDSAGLQKLPEAPHDQGGIVDVLEHESHLDDIEAFGRSEFLEIGSPYVGFALERPLRLE